MTSNTYKLDLNWVLLALALMCGLAISSTTSAQDSSVSYRDQVQKMYITYYGRAGDPPGLDFWEQQLADNDGNLSGIIDAFGNSAEYDSRFGGQENEILVNNIFVNTLNRDADAEGLAFYLEGLESGEFTLASIALNIADGIQEGNPDAVAYANKLAASNRFSAAIAATGATYGAADIDNVKGILAAVGDGSDSLGTALDLVDEFAGIDPSAVDIVATAIGAGGFETLVAALQATGLDAALADETQAFTVFAPTDDAFAALGEDTINALLGDTDTLSNILLYHAIGGAGVDSTTAVGLAGSTVEMVNGDIVALTLREGELFINNSQVVVTDIAARNGVIHVIDTVVLPPEPVIASGSIVDVAVANGGFNTLVAALQATGLDAVLADETQTFTVFAPTDAAFDVLGEETINDLLADTDTLSNILLYHVISGAAVDSITALSLTGTSVTMASGGEAALSVGEGALFINQAQIVTADIVTDNGTIHVIDAVILPPEPATTIVDVAVADGRFTTLVAALQATGLDMTLADADATFTVFAPTDTAFAALGEETINSLLADTDTLSNILLYHVISGSAVDAETAIGLAGSSVEMANGDLVELSLDGDALFINDALVIITDVEADNGTIHVIDAVLLPPES